MLKRLFSLSNGALLVALSLSTIAAWYSIIGLTAIFAGAVVPIIIMGTALEFAKITTTVWLRKYWYRCSLIMKIYLVPAVVLLALLTSMGIFGFLSKAHLDQNIGSGDIQAQVSLLDEKIATQRETIKSSKSMLAQMDQQVNDIMTKGDSEKSVERSVAIRKQQAKERASLQKDIEVANKEIQKLNEERAPIASELRKVEAEVGPIKYIAALIYGDNPDANVLEKAVRWVIILLVSVFDPLAIMLVLAANQSKEWDKHVDEEEDLREEVEHEKVVEAILDDVPKYEADDGPLTEEQMAMVRAAADRALAKLEVTDEEEEAFKALEPKPEPEEALRVDPHPIGWMYEGENHTAQPEVKEESILDKHPYLNQPFTHFTDTTPIVATKALASDDVAAMSILPPDEDETRPFTEEEIMALNGNDGIDEEEFLERFDENLAKGHEIESPILTLGIDEVERPGDYVTQPVEAERVYEVDTDVIPKFEVIPNSDYVVYEGRQMKKSAFKGQHPELALEVDNPREPKTDFGTTFPMSPRTSDTFVRVDAIPNRVYKYNGLRWIETNRSTTDTYLSNAEYLQFLVEKIATGEYDPEQLTEQEEDAIRVHISGK